MSEASEFEADGDSQLAKAARAKADGVRKAAGAKQQQVQQERFNKAWAENYGRLSEKETWLKDQSSPEYKRTVELLQRVPFLTAMPDGLVHAVELMKLQDTAGRSQSLESENKALKEQLSKLQQKTAIGKLTKFLHATPCWTRYIIMIGSRQRYATLRGNTFIRRNRLLIDRHQ